MRLQLMSWPEVQRYLEGSNGVIVPIGATEQHGPIGLIGTDAICAETLSWKAGELCGALVGPTLTVGMSEHHMHFPGSITLRPTTLAAVVRDVVLSLARHGFRRVLFVNGHGGNTVPAKAAASDLLARREDVEWIWRSWWEHPAVKALEDTFFGDRNGDHATAAEISMTMHLFPGAVAPIDRLTVEHPDHEWPLGPRRFRETFPDGRIGSDPSLADADKGKRLFELCVEIYGTELDDLLARQA